MARQSYAKRMAGLGRKPKRNAGKRLKSVAPKLYKAVKQIAKVQAMKAQETKYVASNVTDNTPVLATNVTPGGLIPITTQIAPGTGDNQRIGDTVRPIVCKAHFTFYFDASTTNNQDLLVNFWVVRSKSAKAPQQVVSLSGNNFLKLGNGTNVDPNNPSQPQQLTCVSQYPLNLDAYTPLFHRNFRMRKGYGASAGTSVGGYIAPTGTMASEDLRTITYSWNPAVHHYDATLPVPYTNYPINEVPLVMIWATNADGSGGTHNLVYGLRTEEFFKDA